jgi:hypothetical protein
MRLPSVSALAILMVACGDSSDRSAVPATHANVQSADEVIATISLDSAYMHIKPVDVLPDPADAAGDPDSCKRAGGTWSTTYVLGVLVFREPQPDAVPDGETCWSNRPPTRLADAGKACVTQSDCIGNCTAERLPSGGWSAPQCQTFREDSMCDRPIHDNGKRYWLQCPIP